MSLAHARRALERALAQGDDEAAEQAARALAAHGADAWAVVRPWLTADDPDRRWWAIRVAAALPQAPPDLGPALVQALDDPDPAVRQAAALALRHHPDARARQRLLHLLRAGDPLTAGLAADALAALGREAVPGLIEALRHGPPQARREAARALAQVRDPRAIPALYAALDDPSPHVTAWAEEALHRLGIGMVFWTF